MKTTDKDKTSPSAEEQDKNEQKTKPRSPIKRLYNWTVKWSQHRHALRALTVMSFAESSFFPVPPDPLLLTMTFTKPKKWLKYAGITTAASVIGGIFGYLIGLLLFESLGTWIIDSLHLQHEFVAVGEWYDRYAFWAVLAAAFSPIPYKLFTIAGGVFRINFFGFLLASIIGRGGRFFLVAFLSKTLGSRYREKIEHYIDYISLATVVLIAVLFLILK